MKEKFCVVDIKNDRVEGQLITNRKNQFQSVYSSRFPITPQVGDVFLVDCGIAGAMAVISLVEDEKVFTVPTVIKQTVKVDMVVPAKTQEEANEFAVQRSLNRTEETLLLGKVVTVEANT